MTDRDRKGRQASGVRSGRYTKPERTARGERSGKARWTDNDIRAMRAAYADGENFTSIATRMGTYATNVARIVRRQAWAHVE